MSLSDDNQDWDFSDSEERDRSKSKERVHDAPKHPQPHSRPQEQKASPGRDVGLPTPTLNQKKSDLQDLVDEYETDGPRDYRRRDRDDRDRGDRGDRRGYRGDRGGGRFPRERHFSSHSSRLNS